MIAIAGGIILAVVILNNWEVCLKLAAYALCAAFTVGLIIILVNT